MVGLRRKRERKGGMNADSHWVKLVLGVKESGVKDSLSFCLGGVEVLVSSISCSCSLWAVNAKDAAAAVTAATWRLLLRRRRVHMLVLLCAFDSFLDLV